MPRTRMMQIGGILTAALLFIVTALKSQAPAAQVWEYSSVTGSPESHNWTQSGFDKTATDSAKICYATPQGCRIEEITTSISASDRLTGQGIMLAAAKLGEQGWELTSSTDVNSEFLWERVLYFRRLKRDSK